MKKEKSCGAVVFCGNKFLLVKGHNKNWDFPKGHVEKGETEEETAIREICEEIGARVELIPGFREEIKYQPKKGVLKTVVFFLGKLNSKELMIDPEEIKNYKWLYYEQAMMHLTFEDTRKVLVKARKFLER